MTTRKPQDKNNLENIVVHVVLYSPKDPKGEEYECVGALVRDEKDMIRVAFSAKNNVVDEYIDIQRVDIMSIDIVDPMHIESLQ